MWKIFDPLTGRCDDTYTNRNSMVNHVIELCDGRIVICFWEYDSTLMQIWNLQTKKCDVNLYLNHHTIQIIELSDGRIMSHGYRTDIWNHRTIIVNIWKLDNSTKGLVVDGSFLLHKSDKCFNMFPDGQIIMRTNRHMLARWDPQTKDIRIVSKNDYANINDILMLSNGQIIINNSRELKISTNIHHAKKSSKTQFRIIVRESYILNCIECFDDQIAYLCRDGNLKIFDLKNNICDQVIPIYLASDISKILLSGVIICATQKGIVCATWKGNVTIVR
jgi:hypothetical protein